MTGLGHVIFACASTAVVAEACRLYPTVGHVLITILGTLLPDIDGGGMIARPGKMIFESKNVLVRALNFITAQFSRLVKATLGHRGLLHAPIIGVALVAVGWKLRLPYIAWFGFGYLMHLAADILTPDGVPLFAPLSTKRYSLKLFRTGGLKEAIFVGVYLVLALQYATHGF